MRKRRSVNRIVLFASILVLVLAVIMGGLRILESTFFYQEHPQEEAVPSKTVERDGVSYFPRQDITVILVMGIDDHGPAVSSGYYRNDGAADAVLLMILDQADETYSVVCLNRDMMVHMPVLGLGGKQAGTDYAQLALAHTYGEGLEDSCENTRTTVSALFHGITIDHYVSMHMDGIAIVNDAVGGVTVNVTEDFSMVDPGIPMGTVTLYGEHALNYVRSRKDVGSQLNITRMSRHQEYMNGMMSALSENIHSSDTFVLELYEDISEYIVTDCSVNVINSILNRCADYTLKEVVVPQGENVRGETYYEFYVDEEALFDLTLRLFYAPKN